MKLLSKNSVLLAKFIIITKGETTILGVPEKLLSELKDYETPVYLLGEPINSNEEWGNSCLADQLTVKEIGYRFKTTTMLSVSGIKKEILIANETIGDMAYREVFSLA